MPEFKLQRQPVAQKAHSELPKASHTKVGRPVSLAEVEVLIRTGEYGIESALSTKNSMKYLAFELSVGKETKRIIRLGKVRYEHPTIAVSAVEELSLIPDIKIEVDEPGAIRFSRLGTILTDYHGTNIARSILEGVYGPEIKFTPKPVIEGFEPLLMSILELPRIDCISKSRPTYLGQVQAVLVDGDYVLHPGSSMKYLVLELTDGTEREKVIRFGGLDYPEDHILMRARDELSYVPGATMKILESGTVSHKASEIFIDVYEGGDLGVQALLEDIYFDLKFKLKKAPQECKSARRK